MTEFHIEIPPMARIGKWKSKFPRRQVIVAKKDDEMLNLICCNSIWSRCPLHLWNYFCLFCFVARNVRRLHASLVILNQVWSGLGSLTSKVHRYSVLTIGQRIFIGWLPLIHTLLLNGLCCRSKCSKWDASLASAVQYNSSHLLHILCNTNRVFCPLCTIQFSSCIFFAQLTSHICEIICSNSG